MSPSVHILWRGSVLCGALHGEPRHWGTAARWIGANDPGWKEHATCSTCREQAAIVELEQRRERSYLSGVFMRPEGRPAIPLLLGEFG